jgi:hypothetical protein
MRINADCPRIDPSSFHYLAETLVLDREAPEDRAEVSAGRGAPDHRQLSLDWRARKTGSRNGER